MKKLMVIGLLVTGMMYGAADDKEINHKNSIYEALAIVGFYRQKDDQNVHTVFENPQDKALFKAIGKRDVAAARTALAAGADVNGDGFLRDLKPLYDAMAIGCLEMVQLLLDKGANAAYSSKAFGTALHNPFIWSDGNPESRIIIRKLLKGGLDPNARGTLGETALHIFASVGGPEDDARVIPLIVTLLEAGARTDIKGGSEQETPIEWARRNPLRAEVMRAYKPHATTKERLEFSFRWKTRFPDNPEIAASLAKDKEAYDEHMNALADLY